MGVNAYNTDYNKLLVNDTQLALTNFAHIEAQMGVYESYKEDQDLSTNPLEWWNERRWTSLF